MAASGLKVPELALDPAEAKSLAEATATVAAYYPVSIDPKIMAWSNLIMVAGAIYGSRAIAIYARSKSDKKRPHIAGHGSNVHEMRTAQPPAPKTAGFDPMAVQAGPLPG